MNPMLAVSALAMGLLGSTHCVLMCGGVVAMTCSALPLERRKGASGPLSYVLAFNGGRIASYAAAGAVCGALGASLPSLGGVSQALVALRVAAGIFMVAVGLYVAGWSGVLRWAERVGEPVWRRIAPLARALVPVRTRWQALALGLVWGWMPCGLVYAALAASLTSGSVSGGAATMTAFGVGTLPTLVAMGSLAAAVKQAARNRWIRASAGVAILAFGLVQLSHARAMLSPADGLGTHTCCAGRHTP